jgi:Ca2+-binding RTX toxin-like protein
VACLVALVGPSLARAGTAQLDNPDPGAPHLTFTGAGGEANHVLVMNAFDGYRLIDHGAAIAAGPGCSIVNSAEVFCELSAFEAFEEPATVEVLAGDMNDFVSVSTLFPYDETTIDGGDGADVLEFSSDCDFDFAQCQAHLHGGPGSDTLRGQAGIISLDGGAGGDTMEGSSAEVDYTMRVNPVTATGDGLANDGEAGENDNILTVEFVLGGAAGDTFTNIDAIGGAGRDTFISTSVFGSFSVGGAGNDTFIGGVGEDDFFGGRGADTLTGAGGIDDLEGGRGADTIRGGAGRDFLVGSKGADVLVGGAGREFEMSGGGGNDTLRARDGNQERVNGGAGSDSAQVDYLDIVSSIESFF